jgi:hypothetical protein
MDLRIWIRGYLASLQVRKSSLEIETNSTRQLEQIVLPKTRHEAQKEKGPKI